MAFVAHTQWSIAVRFPDEAGLADRGRLLLDLLAALRERHSRGVGLVVDLASTRSIDSAGLRALLVVGRRADELGVNFCLAAPNPSIRRLLALVDIDRCVPVLDSVASGLVAVSDGAAEARPRADSAQRVLRHRPRTGPWARPGRAAPRSDPRRPHRPHGSVGP